MTLTDEQAAFIDFCRSGTGCGIGNARAGTGKSTAIVEAAKAAPARYRVLIVAFNVVIADHMAGLLGEAGLDNVQASTFNSIGWRTCLARMPYLKLDKHRLRDILKAEFSIEGNAAAKLIDLARLTLSPLDPASLTQLCDRYEIELFGDDRERVISLVPAIVERLKQVRKDQSADFTDQLWLPVALNLRPRHTYDIVFCDEAQDINAVQRAFLQSLCPSGRIIAVGDENQAICGFRGADTDSISAMRSMLAPRPGGVREFPLTLSWRCPQSHVRLVHPIVPDFRAMPDAPEGSIDAIGDKLLTHRSRDMRTGDMILSRTNAPLIRICIGLIRNRIAASIRGVDIASGLSGLARRIGGDTRDEFRNRLIAWRMKIVERETLKPLAERSQALLSLITDRYECLMALSAAAGPGDSADTIGNSVLALFSDKTNAVNLGTIHRMKGTEAPRVFVIGPIPHPFSARAGWQRQQEFNLAYVAATRVRGGGPLTFTSRRVPTLYSGVWPKQPEREDYHGDEDAFDSACAEYFKGE